MIHLDGSQGEGGGQILRTALSLSALLGLPVTIENIRANRPKAGLRPQHLTAVKALKEICGAEVEGMAVDSRRIAFRPGRVRPGNYFFDVGTAGSVTLILQALLLPLALVAGPFPDQIEGRYPCSLEPALSFLSEVFLPTLTLMGIQTAVRLGKWGWYPKGGGELEMDIHSAEMLTPLVLDQPWEPEEVRVLCASSCLPGHILERERKRIEVLLSERRFKARFELTEVSILRAGKYGLYSGPERSGHRRVFIPGSQGETGGAGSRGGGASLFFFSGFGRRGGRTFRRSAPALPGPRAGPFEDPGPGGFLPSADQSLGGQSIHAFPAYLERGAGSGEDNHDNRLIRL